MVLCIYHYDLIVHMCSGTNSSVLLKHVSGNAQLLFHLLASFNNNNLHSASQSAYNPHHSIDTPLLTISNDVQKMCIYINIT